MRLELNDRAPGGGESALGELAAGGLGPPRVEFEPLGLDGYSAFKKCGELEIALQFAPEMAVEGINPGFSFSDVKLSNTHEAPQTRHSFASARDQDGIVVALQERKRPAVRKGEAVDDVDDTGGADRLINLYRQASAGEIVNHEEHLCFASNCKGVEWETKRPQGAGRIELIAPLLAPMPVTCFFRLFCGMRNQS